MINCGKAAPEVNPQIRALLIDCQWKLRAAAVTLTGHCVSVHVCVRESGYSCLSCCSTHSTSVLVSLLFQDGSCCPSALQPACIIMHRQSVVLYFQPPGLIPPPCRDILPQAFSWSYEEKKDNRLTSFLAALGFEMPGSLHHSFLIESSRAGAINLEE